ncbi:MAG TPA: phage holin family protein [Limnobacter sp.]|nr:phage holin family protein [Limnobacter sp.]
MLNPNAKAALKRVVANLLNMSQTRLELAGIEITQVRQTTIKTVVWSLLTAMAAVLASVFVCTLIIVLAWESYRHVAIAACAAFYAVLGVYFWSQLKETLAAQPPLFEATLAELARDKQAVMESLQEDALHEATRQDMRRQS